MRSPVVTFESEVHSGDYLRVHRVNGRAVISVKDDDSLSVVLLGPDQVEALADYLKEIADGNAGRVSDEEIG